MAKIKRVEVYVDGATKPFKVIEKEPFAVKLHPDEFSEGDHVMQVVVAYDNGDYHEQPYIFTIAHKNEVSVGHISRAPIGSPIEVDLIDPMETAGMPAPNLVYHAILPAVLFILILVVSGWFSIYGDTSASDEVTNIQPISHVQPQAGAASGGAVDGAALYAENCASCHGANGQGQGDIFPALAGNANLADTDLALNTVIHGREGTAMPVWGDQMNDEQIAAVINYIRSAWGNDFGSVTPEDVAAKR